MSHKIAIISQRNVNYSYDYDNYGDILVANSITDWEEVSDEDYLLLQEAASRSGAFRIVEQIRNQKIFIAKTIADYKKLVQEEADRAAAEKKRKVEEALERKLKKELRDKKSKTALLEKLVAELGPDAVKSVISK